MEKKNRLSLVYAAAVRSSQNGERSITTNAGKIAIILA
jgi:hypothetical protein